MLEITHTIEKRKMQEQVLDSMELERERGITIKMQPVRMQYSYKSQEYILNLIDTPVISISRNEVSEHSKLSKAQFSWLTQPKEFKRNINTLGNGS